MTLHPRTSDINCWCNAATNILSKVQTSSNIKLGLGHNSQENGHPLDFLNKNKTGRGSKGSLRAAKLGRHNKEYYTHTQWALTKSIISSQLYYPIILKVWISGIQTGILLFL